MNSAGNLLLLLLCLQEERADKAKVLNVRLWWGS
jgi:hypothetical protein